MLAALQVILFAYTQDLSLAHFFDQTRGTTRRSLPADRFKTMPNGRESVPIAQIRVLLSRSGNVCAYPECERELVLDARSQGGPSKSIGKIAHICAASQGGPRYDASMSSLERVSVANLIYLCSDHHDLIDTQIADHPPELLRKMRGDHEAAVRRAVRAVSGNLTYDSLALVCAVIAAQMEADVQEIELSLAVQAKINLNDLGPQTAQLIETGLAQATRVQEFIAFQSGQVPRFERRLVARIRADYEEGIAAGLVGDDAFDYVRAKTEENAGPRDTVEIRAAALAVVALMFEICEIFEHD